MKKMILAALALLSVNFAANAFFGRRGGNCCPTNRCAPARSSCAAPCATTASCEVAPKCCKTIMVDKVIQVPQTVEVPARRIEVPQPDIIEMVPQPCKEVRHPQPPCIRYECPDDCERVK